MPVIEAVHAPLLNESQPTLPVPEAVRTEPDAEARQAAAIVAGGANAVLKIPNIARLPIGAHTGAHVAILRRVFGQLSADQVPVASFQSRI